MKVGLFITCLANSLRPSIGIATLKLLKNCGCEVIVPSQQTCCGQPLFNSGYTEKARQVALTNLSLFDECDYVIVPSGSCGGMIHHHYADLFATSSPNKLKQLSAKTVELCQFLKDIIDWHPQSTILSTLQFTYHDCCAGLRELKIKSQPRQLLQRLKLTVVEMQQPEECCGFGGVFSVKFDALSTTMSQQKLDDAKQTEANAIIMGDYGCMMHLAGRASRLDNNYPAVFHISEVLAHYSNCYSHQGLN